MHLTQRQVLLVQGLKLFGCSRTEALVIGLELARPEAVEEMLSYMVEHQDASPAQLLDKSAEISRRWTE